MKAKKMNLKWAKSVFLLFSILVVSQLGVYAIACVVLVLICSLAIYFSMKSDDNEYEMMRKPKPLQFRPYKEKKFNALKLEQLRKMDPFLFEEYVASIYRRLGFSDAKATQSTADGGKDVVMHKDRDDSRKLYYVECKRYKGTVGREIIQKLVGAAVADKAIPYATVTTGRFTKEAIEEAKKTGVQCIGPRELLEMIEIVEEIEKKSEKLESSELNPSVSN